MVAGATVESLASYSVAAAMLPHPGAGVVLSGVLLDVALEVNFCTFWQQPLASFAAAAIDDRTTTLCGHAGAESVLLLASPLRRSVCRAHGF